MTLHSCIDNSHILGIYAVAPRFGSLAGGTRVTLRGEGIMQLVTLLTIFCVGESKGTTVIHISSQMIHYYH